MEIDRTYLETKADRVFAFDKSIRFVVLLTPEGRPIMEASRPGVTSLEPRTESQTVYVQAGMAVDMAAPTNKYYGRLRTSVLVREKVTIICFNLAGRILLISTEPEFHLQKVEQLGQLIDELNLA